MHKDTAKDIWKQPEDHGNQEIDRRTLLAGAAAGATALLLAGCKQPNQASPVEASPSSDGGGETPEQPEVVTETEEVEKTPESRGDVQKFDEFAKSSAEVIAKEVISHLYDEGKPAFIANYNAQWNGSDEQTGERLVKLTLQSTMVHDPENQYENPDRLDISYYEIAGIDDILNVTEGDINRVVRDYTAQRIGILRFPAHSSVNQDLEVVDIERMSSGETIRVLDDDGVELDFDETMDWAERLVEQIKNRPDY